MNQTQTRSKTGKTTTLPDLIVASAMVNPQGKQARIGSKVPNNMLNSEWVQLRNMTERPILLNGLTLQHLTYPGGDQGKLTGIMTLQGQLPADSFLRIHSGQGSVTFDKKHKTYHVYVNSPAQNFFYQTAKGDTIAITHPNGSIVDQAVYDLPVLEGVRLSRVPPITVHRLEHHE